MSWAPCFVSGLPRYTHTVALNGFGVARRHSMTLSPTALAPRTSTSCTLTLGPSQSWLSALNAVLPLVVSLALGVTYVALGSCYSCSGFAVTPLTQAPIAVSIGVEQLPNTGLVVAVLAVVDSIVS